MRLYIIRHGETEWNKEKRMQGQRDIMLDQEGIRLAALTGKGMQDVPIDIAISSPLLRAKHSLFLQIVPFRSLLTRGFRKCPLVTGKENRSVTVK